MQRQSRSPSSLFRAVSFAVVATLVMTVSAWAQNSVPPTAVQAAKMPEFASRLAHPVKRPGLSMSPARARARNHRGSLDSNDIYDNGPINGNTDAWTINFGFIVSDSFNVTASNATVTGMTFAAWLFPGDTLTSAEISITSGINGGTSYFDQTVNFTQGTCTSNQFGYNVCTETTSFNGPNLNAGTYWVNLQNAAVPDGDLIYWDENSGPSSASQNQVGTIPSESFTILGNATTTTSTSYQNYYSCPPPQSGFHDLHDFSADAGPSGVAIDTAGNLYSTLAKGGSYGSGMIYDLALRAGRLFFSSLYSFPGGSNGSTPSGVIVGPEGVLYGAASGGLQNCGGRYCGLIFEARPSPTACPTALCGWNETTIYQFTSNTDAAGGIVSAFDSSGNLYGISESGGANGAGAVFELSPSGGGWKEQVLYSFIGESNGGLPTSLLVGNDGNLYGTALQGGNYDTEACYGWCGIIFQLAQAGGGWTENVIHAFVGGYTDGGRPSGLIQAQTGLLYGLSVCAPDLGTECNYGTGDEEAGIIYSLSPSGGDFNLVYVFAYQEQGGCQLSGNVTFGGLALDANQNLYATEGGEDGCGQYCTVYCGAVINVVGGSYRALVSGGAPIFSNLTSDAGGNLYGTAPKCGFESPLRTTGMVWQYSP